MYITRHSGYSWGIEPWTNLASYVPGTTVLKHHIKYNEGCVDGRMGNSTLDRLLASTHAVYCKNALAELSQLPLTNQNK